MTAIIPENIKKITAFLKKSGCFGTLFNICLNIRPFLVVNPVWMTIALVCYPTSIFKVP